MKPSESLLQQNRVGSRPPSWTSVPQAEEGPSSQVHTQLSERPQPCLSEKTKLMQGKAIFIVNKQFKQTLCLWQVSGIFEYTDGIYLMRSYNLTR